MGVSSTGLGSTSVRPIIPVSSSERAGSAGGFVAIVVDVEGCDEVADYIDVDLVEYGVGRMARGDRGWLGYAGLLSLTMSLTTIPLHITRIPTAKLLWNSNNPLHILKILTRIEHKNASSQQSRP